MRKLYEAELVEIKCKKTKWGGDRKMEYKKSGGRKIEHKERWIEW